MNRKLVLVAALLPSVSGLIWRGASCALQVSAVIAIDKDKIYQTITGWEATSQAAQIGCGDFSLFQEELFDRVVDELGINRLRLELMSGFENDRDYWTALRGGDIDLEAWRAVRNSTINDNDDPLSINWSGFHFSQLDHTIESVLLPLKRRVEANGEKLFINLNYVAFTSQIGSGREYHHDDPDEYAEAVLATYLHLQNKYAWVPDTWEIILEPDNVPEWNGRLIGEAIAAAANRLEASGFSPAFIAPSTAAMSNAVPYFDALIGVPGVKPHLKTLSYHRYRGVSIGNLRTIVSRAAQHDLRTGMLEHIGSGYRDLHDDLKTGGNSTWQQYTLAFCTDDNGAQYYWIDIADPSRPRVNMGSRTRFLRQYFKFIRGGAVRIEASTNDARFDPLAFVNPDGRYVVVVKADDGGTFSVKGLPAGTYGVKYTTETEYDIDAQDVTLDKGRALSARIPRRGVISVYAKP